MTLLANSHPAPSAPPVQLPAELLDMICEAVLSHPDEVTRGAVTTRLVREIHQALTWFHSDPSHPELASFQRLVTEAEAHQARQEPTHTPNPPPPEPPHPARQTHHSNFCDRLVYGHRPCNCPRGDHP